ncbi:MAG: iron ABC transporter permease [Treponema sp.]|jgi:iron complex transport system permease protein|nr:iron ABC transporter permease [Treponema sp.]
MKDSGALLVYKQKRRECRRLILCFAVLVPILCVFALGLGVMRIPAVSITRILAGKLAGIPALYQDIPAAFVAVVWDLRFPRIICALFTGASLAVAGVIFQGILQNHLADPYTIGVSTGAAFGASLAVFINMVSSGVLSVPFMALCFAGFTLIVVLAIAGRGNGLAAVNLIMAGVIVSAIFQAGISFLKMLSGENVGAIVFWLMGSLSARGWKDAALLAPASAAAIAAAAVFSENLNLLSLGEREAESLGLNAGRARLFFLLLGAFITAVSVSVAGIIGFVGLVVPHVLRFAFTSDNRYLIPLAALSGGLLLCAADSIARLIFTGEIPVGVLTTLLGGPFFIYIFIAKNRRKL